MQIIGCQFNGGRANILFQTVQLARTRDGYDKRFLSQQPSQSNLGWCRLDFFWLNLIDFNTFHTYSADLFHNIIGQ